MPITGTRQNGMDQIVPAGRRELVKIGFTGIELPEGKIKYNDEILIALKTKDEPKKYSPFFVEFIPEEFIQCEAIVIPRDKILDLLIHDMEKIELRLDRVSDNWEKEILTRCMDRLEMEIPLCDVDFNEEQHKMLRGITPYSLKPVIQIQGDEDIGTIIHMTFEKADYMFFYTSGNQEFHAWLEKKNSSIISCAEKIHSDLARGFIKGEVVSFENYMSCHNFNDCRSKRLVKLVDRDYIVQPREIIEIRFNVK